MLSAWGGVFNQKRRYIEQLFDIVAMSDNHLDNISQEAGNKYVRMEEIIYEKFDYILVCSDEYYNNVKAQLVDYGIPSQKIVGPELLSDIEWNRDFNKYKSDKMRYQELMCRSELTSFLYSSKDENIRLSDYRQQAGMLDTHYFYQDILVASLIIKSKVEQHVDIGSRIDGFISHLLAAGIHTTVIDIRPLDICSFGFGVPDLKFIQSDATNLNNVEDCSIPSLSSLHAVEHFGLGRYGDEISPGACFEAMDAMKRVLGKNGTLYLSSPVGAHEKVCFNAHRIFSPETIIKQMEGLILREMFLIHNGETFHFTGEEAINGSYESIIGEYDCGIFIFYKE